MVLVSKPVTIEDLEDDRPENRFDRCENYIESEDSEHATNKRYKDKRSKWPAKP